MKVARKGNNLCAGIEHDPPDPPFADEARQGLQPTHVTSAQGRTGLHFHSHQPPGGVLEHQVHFLTGRGAPIEKFRLRVAPSGFALLLPKLGPDWALTMLCPAAAFVLS